jgi:stage V sporulation protein G
MEITEISIKLRDEKKLKAFVNVAFDNVFAVKGMKVIKGTKGYLLCMPSRKSDDTQRDIAHPINREFRQKIEKQILEEYHRVAADAGNGKDAHTPFSSPRDSVKTDLVHSDGEFVWKW